MAAHTLDLQNLYLSTESLSVNTDFTSVIKCGLKDFTSQSLQPEIWRSKVYGSAVRIHSETTIVRLTDFDDRSGHWLKENLRNKERE